MYIRILFLTDLNFKIFFFSGIELLLLSVGFISFPFLSFSPTRNTIKIVFEVGVLDRKVYLLK